MKARLKILNFKVYMGLQSEVNTNIASSRSHTEHTTMDQCELSILDITETRECMTCCQIVNIWQVFKYL